MDGVFRILLVYVSKEWVTEGINCTYSLLWVDAQHLFQQINSLMRCLWEQVIEPSTIFLGHI